MKNLFVAMKLSFLASALACVGVLFFSCVSAGKPELCSRELRAPGIKSSSQLVNFFMSENPSADRQKVVRLAGYYSEEADAEGINSDAAFVQMCLETGFLRFGNLVTPEMNNFCGLGAMDAAHRGEVFPTEQIGVRAHIQHLQAYATKEDVKLKKKLVDPRYGWVHKAKYAETVFDLATQWATDPEYGRKIDALMTKLDSF